ncbi:MAG: hypothetical protein J6R83_03230, partial [Clostridia bacterium]|nr:hypothetical protein [Clostridia bacterium]
ILKQKWEEKKQEYAVNGLPILEGETIKLTKNEVCHFADVANFCKIKTHTTGYEGGSRGTSIRLMKGVSFRVGNYRGHYVKEEITEKTEGRIYLTSKKIVFTAPLNSCIIKYDAIINIGVTNGMVQFQTEDKTYLFQMENYLDFMIILESVAYKNEENE